jgi:hypothetical protein
MSASAADRVFQAAMALAPLSAGACRTGFVILTANPIAGHAQRASGGNSGQDDPAAAGALDVDPGRRQAPALDHRRAPHPGRRPCRRTPRQSRPPLRSSKRLPGTSVSLPGITLSDKGGQGERAHCRRSGRMSARYRSRHWMYRFGPSALGLASPARRCGQRRPGPKDALCGVTGPMGWGDTFTCTVCIAGRSRLTAAPRRKQCEGASRGPGGGTSGPAGSRAGALVLLA